ncbi:CheR family methyltransferase [Massilia cavernae]|uniref:CheR family methyltransferase n=1 Tax=Massilia cavernae TaxID=2320864 RepID=UPI0026A8C590
MHALMQERGLSSVSMLQNRVLHEAGASHALLRALSVPPAELFDSPELARSLRTVFRSSLGASAMPRIWLAECGGAEEAWSLAILLADEQLIARTEIHATSSNEQVLANTFDAGIDPARMPEYQQRYEQSGGCGKLEDYFEKEGGRLVLVPQLRSRISWAQYNLVTDASFNEFELIVCRRALPDFGPVLRRRVLRLFHDSLSRFGMLLIDREFETGEPLSDSYQHVLPYQGLYKRVA